MNFYRFCSEGTDERVQLRKCLLQGFVVRFFESSSYRESSVFMNLQNFFLKFKQNPSKILEEFIFSLFVVISYAMVKIESSSKKTSQTSHQENKDKEKVHSVFTTGNFSRATES